VVFAAFGFMIIALLGAGLALVPLVVVWRLRVEHSASREASGFMG